MALYARLWTDILGDEKLMRAARKGAKQLHLLPWLIAFAKKVDDNGRLSVNGEPAEPDDIAALLPCVTPRQMAVCLSELEALGILVRDEDTTLRLAAWEFRSGKPSDGKEKINERVRRHRQKKAGNETPMKRVSKALRGSRGNATEQEQEQEQEIAQALHVVLEHYVARHPRRKPGAKEKAAVRKALEQYDPGDLIAAIDGNADDAWHRERHKHELTYVLRDSGKIDTFAAKGRAAPEDRRIVDEFGCFTEYGERVTRPALVKAS